MDIRKYIIEALRIGNLPDFLIIGVQKGGTTSLRKYMSRHPKIAFSNTKELHYFDNLRYKWKNLAWYKSQFPILRFNRIFGESTPSYLYFSGAPKRIYKTIPDVKLIILLRNPVDRAFSNYIMELNRENETICFKKAIKYELRNYKNELMKVRRGKYSFDYNHRFYLYKGIYFRWIKKYFNYFDKDNILILKSEDFFFQTNEIMTEIFNFLKIKKMNLDFTELKTYKKSKYSVKLDGRVEKWLYNYYRPFNYKLYKLIEKKFNWEKNSKK